MVVNIRLLVLLLAGICLCSCNHLFYQPTKDHFVEREKIPLLVENVKINSTDGVVLNAWIWTKTMDPKGVLIQFHGNAENMTTHGFSVAWLANFNYAVVTFDYRGYGKSTGEPTRSGLVDDGKAVLDFVGRHPVLGKLDSFVIGQSLGGAVVVPVIAEKQNYNTRALILESTFSSYREIVQNKLGSFWLTWPLQYPLSYLVTDDLSPIDYIQKVKLPVLVIHGTSDRIVPFENIEPLLSKVQSSKELWKVEKGRHLETFVFKDYRKKLVKYLCALRQINPCLDKL